MTSNAPFTCASSLVSDDLKAHALLVGGPNVIELPKLSEGTYSFSCSMGMYSGRIVVIKPPAAAAS